MDWVSASGTATSIGYIPAVLTSIVGSIVCCVPMLWEARRITISFGSKPASFTRARIASVLWNGAGIKPSGAGMDV